MKIFRDLLVLVFLFVVCFNSFAIDKDVNQASQYYNEGIDYYKNGKYEEAVTSLSKAIQADKTLTDAYYFRGRIYMEYYKDYDKAIADFNQIVVINKSDFEAYYLMGACYFNKGDSNNAMACYNKAINAFVQLYQSSGGTITLDNTKSLFPYYDMLAINYIDLLINSLSNLSIITNTNN